MISSDRLTIKTQELVKNSFDLAARLSHQQIETVLDQFLGLDRQTIG